MDINRLSPLLDDLASEDPAEAHEQFQGFMDEASADYDDFRIDFWTRNHQIIEEL